MSLEQSVDRLSNLIEQLIHQLELGRTPRTEAPTGQAEAPKPEKPAKAPKAEKPVESSGATKGSGKSTAPTDTGESTGAKKAPTDCHADVAPSFSKLVAKDREAAVKILKRYQDANGKTGKLCEVLKPEDLEGCLADVLAALGE